MKTLRIILLAVVLSPLSVMAQQGSIALKNEAFKEVAVTDKDGKTEYKLVEPGTVVPKDEIVYITTFENVSDKPVNNIEVVNPLPNNSIYKTGSAFGAGTVITYSIDGGETYAAPEKLTIKDETGQLRPATAEDYTHIRWVYTQDLQPGKTGTVMFRTVIK